MITSILTIMRDTLRDTDARPLVYSDTSIVLSVRKKSLRTLLAYIDDLTVRLDFQRNETLQSTRHNETLSKANADLLKMLADNVKPVPKPKPQMQAREPKPAWHPPMQWPKPEAVLAKDLWHPAFEEFEPVRARVVHVQSAPHKVPCVCATCMATRHVASALFKRDTAEQEDDDSWHPV